MITRLIAITIFIMSGVFLNGCAVMAVRTGVRTVRTMEENAEHARPASESEQAGQEKKTGLIHRP